VVVLTCDVARTAQVDLDTVDALARFVLAARRCGLRPRLCRVPPGLVELLELAGLEDVLGQPGMLRGSSP
jgi:ABC-type transporter Mla MlaB component